MPDSEKSTERTRVQTYVPAYQREAWEHDADDLDMTLSEFVRSMVQAGRHDFDLQEDSDGTDEDIGRSATPSSAPNPRGSGVEDRVERVLSDGGYYDWDELVAELTADIEDQLDAALAALQEENRVRYSGRDGGYTLL